MPVMTFRRFILSALSLSLFVAPSAFAENFDDFETGILTGDLKANVIETEHFEIEFSDITAGQSDSDGDGIADVVEMVAEAAELSWEVFIDDLGYDDPTSEGVKVIAILDDNDQYLYPGTVGVASIFDIGHPYFAVDPWSSDGVIKVTVAHEFFHNIQFGYDLGFSGTGQGIGFGESTAVWAEEMVYDSVNDYYYYLDDYFNYPDYSIFSAIVPEDSLFEYALSIWPIFLTEYYDEDIIKEIWENYSSSTLADDDHMKVYEAVKDAVEAEGGRLQDVFMEFMLWNLEASLYSEGSNYPDVYSLLDPTQDEYTEILYIYSPTLYGGNYLYFANYDAEDAFYFHIVKGDGISYGVTLAPYDDGEVLLDDVVTVEIDEDEEWEDGLSLEGLGNVDGVVAIVAPLERDFDAMSSTDYAFDDAFSYYYYGSYSDEVTESSGAEEIEVSGESNEKEGEEASTSDEIRNTAGLTFSIHSYDEDSVTFSWNRPNWSDLDHYELYYGTTSGDYDEVEVLEQSYTTVKTISGLEEGVTYYFQLMGMDEDGDLIEEESSEVAVTPAEWLFTDLSYMNQYYESIAALVDEGVFQGYGDGSFKPGNSISRAELLKIFMEGQGITPDESVYKNCFTDVADDWYAKYVCYAKEQEWVRGFGDGSFRPGDTVTKVEALKILFKSYGEDVADEGSFVLNVAYDDVPARAWYTVYVQYASELGILSESTTEDFEPTEDRTRGQMAEQLYRYLVVSELI